MTELYTSLEDPALMARFYDEKKLHPAKTLAAREKNPEAEAVYIPQVMIEIHIKGKSEVMRRDMQEADKKKFAMAWAAYQGQAVQADAGTPLSELPDMDDVTIAQYGQKGIKSVEDMAIISDDAVYQLGRGAVAHKKAAQNYLKNRNDATNNPDVLRRIEAMDEAIANLNRRGGGPAAPALDEAVDSRLSALEMAIADIGAQVQLALQAKEQQAPKAEEKPKKEKLKLKDAESDAA